MTDECCSKGLHHLPDRGFGKVEDVRLDCPHAGVDIFRARAMIGDDLEVQAGLAEDFKLVEDKSFAQAREE